MLILTFLDDIMGFLYESACLLFEMYDMIYINLTKSSNDGHDRMRPAVPS